MDAAELKIVCDNYERRLGALQAALETAQEDLAWRVSIAICVSHGGHEYESNGPGGASYKECKHCGNRIHD